VEAADEGAITATITKKRRPGADTSSVSPLANFVINLGEGKCISLNDTNGVNDLDDEMQDAVYSQMKML
jgi:hypothetical protein